MKPYFFAGKQFYGKRCRNAFASRDSLLTRAANFANLVDRSTHSPFLKAELWELLCRRPGSRGRSRLAGRSRARRRCVVRRRGDGWHCGCSHSNRTRVVLEQFRAQAQRFELALNALHVRFLLANYFVDVLHLGQSQLPAWNPLDLSRIITQVKEKINKDSALKAKSGEEMLRCRM